MGDEEAAMLKVGFLEAQAADRSRESWSGSGPRPLNWCAWYPTDSPQPAQELLHGPNSAALARMGQVVPGARLSPDLGPFPVVLASHGTGGIARDLGWLGRRLAARSFVVLAVDHHGNTHAEPFCPEGFLCWWERASDLTALLDHACEAHPFKGRLDLGRVYAAGFSLGGCTVLSLLGGITDTREFVAWAARQPAAVPGPREVPDLGSHIEPLLQRSRVFRASWERQSHPHDDPRVRAVLSCAPAPPVRGFTAESLKAVSRPMTIVVGGADFEAPPQDCAGWLDEQLPSSHLVTLGPQVGHSVFLCEGTDLGRRADPVAYLDPPGVDRRLVHDNVAALAVRSFGS